jgi:lipoprotein-anchoring transpeptidase ErfK/SrfK
MKKSGKRGGPLVWIGIMGVLAVIAIGFVIFLSWSGSHSNAAAFIPSSSTTQTVSTAGGMNKPTLSRSWLGTSTIAPQQPATPSPSHTPVLSNIFFPEIQKAGDPAPYKARLPLLINTNGDSLTSTPLDPAQDVPFTEKTILVDISDQHVYAYDKGKLVFSFVASTGRNNLTRIGHYRILDKIPNAYSDPWGFWMPYWMGIYYVGYNLENGFHSLPVLSNGVRLWGSQIGSPITYGCVVLRPNDMKQLYYWAGLGTAVVIQK